MYENHVIQPLALIIENNVKNLLILAGDVVAVEHLHFHRLPVGVLIARRFEFFLFGGEALNNVVGCDSLGLGRIERPLLSKRVQRYHAQRNNQDSYPHEFHKISVAN